MLFNSFSFLIFLPIVFIAYWYIFKRYLNLQNTLVLVASYVFYGLWDWRFLSLIFISTILDYSVANAMHVEKRLKRRKSLLWVSLAFNLGMLGFFKYYNFFVDNFIAAFSGLGFELPSSTLNIILPVGISFYTFQTLSYTIDVYRKNLEPTKNFVAFAAFVSFFPQLVAGPIERASNLLPQFYKARKFDFKNAKDGCKQMLWGFFKKMVIADNCAVLVNEVYANHESYGSLGLTLAAVLFAFQIYGDFSGYSDIAIGLSRLFGFELKKNFAFPYFSRDIAEFWRRWHISLSTWFRDYLYIPLGGSKGSTFKKVRNTFIIFLVSGFWHGANWTFLVWGGLNALYFLPLLLLKKNRKNTTGIAEGRILPSFSDFSKIFITFVLTCIAWVFFRAESVGIAFDYLSNIMSFSLQELDKMLFIKAELIIALLVFFNLIEWLGRHNAYAIEKGLTKYKMLNWSLLMVTAVSIGLFARTEETPFIYFQF